MNTCSDDSDTFMNDKNAKQLTKSTEMIGSPFFVQKVKIRGACPRSDRPYRIREAQKRNELLAEKAELKIAALMIEGSVLMPARLIAMTYGDSAALPTSERRFGSLNGTRRPVMKIPRR